MKRFLLTFIILYSLVKSYGQKTNDDSTCVQFLKSAKTEYELGLLKFCTTATWDYPRSRMFEELDSICKTKNLIFTPYPFIEHDYGFDPYSCYVHYMDSVVRMKFGEKFIDNLEKYADSIFIVKHKNDTLLYYLCDKSPEYYKDNEVLTRDFFKKFHLPDICNYIKDRDECIFRVSFVVDINGIASNYVVNGWNIENTCLDEVTKEIIKALSFIGSWIPGEIGGRKIISIGDVMIDLKSKRVN